jgi:ASC-1-like (ASCH) protein
MTHDLKNIQPFFERVRMGQKTSELRLNDRDFQTGDYMNLMEINSTQLTGQVIKTVITHVLSNYVGLKKGYCIISFKILNA